MVGDVCDTSQRILGAVHDNMCRGLNKKLKKKKKIMQKWNKHELK